MSFITPLSTNSNNDSQLVGGKGASLKVMIQAGIPVPPGFIIATQAFETFLTESNLREQLQNKLKELNHKDLHAVHEASKQIQELILHQEISSSLKNDIQAHFKLLKSPYIAVRSSATVEDGTKASWAGELDSFLNTTEENLITSIKRCWASLFTPRAILYRIENNFEGKNISVAVVIQKMIQSEVAGVAFSVHPITQNKNQLIIEAAYGLGEGLVSGQLTPDAYTVNKTDLNIISTSIEKQEKALRKNQDRGNAWTNISIDKQTSQKLSDQKILELAQLIIDIEYQYGFPVDVEWALEKNTFYITQSRPITTLKQA